MKKRIKLLLPLVVLLGGAEPASDAGPSVTLAPSRAAEALEPAALALFNGSAEASLPAVRACYEAFLVAHPTWEGDVAASVTLDKHAVASGVQAYATPPADPAMVACVKDAVRAVLPQPTKVLKSATLWYGYTMRLSPPSPPAPAAQE